MKQFAILLMLLLTMSCQEEERIPITPKPFPVRNSNGVDFHVSFGSQYVNGRHVEVWLPESYDENSDTEYQVLYMHDGQNVFNPETSFNGVDWGVDETVQRLMNEGRIAPTIVVGVWNTNLRFPEYMPQKPKKFMESETSINLMIRDYNTPIISDNYLKFLVTELKPFIDENYNTSPKREDTFIMGSSMGGLISLYAISEYPEVFGGAGCVSIHWTAWHFGEAYKSQVEKNLPDPATHKIYYDYGTRGIDAKYEPHQLEVDDMMKRRGYTPSVNWITQKFEGADHNEESWRDRVHIPLTFLLN